MKIQLPVWMSQNQALNLQPENGPNEPNEMDLKTFWFPYNCSAFNYNYVIWTMPTCRSNWDFVEIIIFSPNCWFILAKELVLHIHVCTLLNMEYNSYCCYQYLCITRICICFHSLCSPCSRVWFLQHTGFPLNTNAED